VVGDCRTLPDKNESKDILVVRGGLHHLHELPDDLERVLAASATRPAPGGTGGRRAVTHTVPLFRPFRLRAAAGAPTVAQGVAAATVIEHERETYEQWLAQPDLILREIRRSFDIATLRTRLGKLMLVGHPRRQVQT